MSCIFCQPAESLLAEENPIFKAHLFPYGAVIIVLEHTVEIDLCSNLLGLLLTNLTWWVDIVKLIVHQDCQIDVFREQLSR